MKAMMIALIVLLFLSLSSNGVLWVRNMQHRAHLTILTEAVSLNLSVGRTLMELHGIMPREPGKQWPPPQRRDLIANHLSHQNQIGFRPSHIGWASTLGTSQRRKLDALFAIYIMGWETKENGSTKWRYFLKPVVEPSSKRRWESDMLPYFHDDTRACYQGVERLRREGKYLTVETREDGYEVVEKTMGLSVRDKDLNFAIMAVCLLIKGVSDKDIQSAISQQDDWTTKAAKRRQEREDGSR